MAGARVSELELVRAVIRYVFGEESAKSISGDVGIRYDALRQHLRHWGIPLRSTHEQRRIDIRRGRYSHTGALRSAWARGAYATERFRETRPTGDWGRPRQGASNPFFGHSHSESVRHRLSELATQRCIASYGQYGPDWTPELRASVIARDGGRCLVCARADAEFQVHHVDLNRANSHTSNLLTLCVACHLGYHGRSEFQDEIREAHATMLLRHADAAEVPSCL